jgi:hypothetical protein
MIEIHITDFDSNADVKKSEDDGKNFTNSKNKIEVIYVSDNDI